MNNNIAIICCIYNAHKLVERSISSLLKTMPENCRLICVDNHSPDEESRRYVADLAAASKLTLVDPGKNIGCHEGWNFGVQNVPADFDPAYLMKLDDDTEIITPRWDFHMTSALVDVKDLAYVSADLNAKQANNYETRCLHGHELEIAPSGVIGFSFVMFRAEDIQSWGPMKTPPYIDGGLVKSGGERLYGGEESYYAQAARRAGMMIAHIPAVRVYHMDNADRHPDFAMWKYCYGYRGWTSKDMIKWIADGDHIDHYTAALATEMSAPHPNNLLLKEWVQRLGQIGVPKVVPLIEQLVLNNKDEAVLTACQVAVKCIYERAPE